MPIVGHLAENGLVVYDEFRQGNVALSAKNLEFIKHCERQIPVVRRPYQLRLFGEKQLDLKERYKVIATNLDFEPEEVVKWYDAREEYSENRIKELKIEFSMERMPSFYFKVNAIFFTIGSLAYNLFRIFQLNILPKGCEKQKNKDHSLEVI